jgi:hypothetical protein
MIKALVTYGSDVTQSGVNLVGHGERGQEIRTARVSHFGGRQYRTQIVGRVTGLAFGEIAVHEIEIPAESAIAESGPIRCCPAAADERCQRSAAERGSQLADGDNGGCVKCTDSYSERIEYPNLQLLHSNVAHISQPRTLDKSCKVLDFGHGDRILLGIDAGAARQWIEPSIEWCRATTDRRAGVTRDMDEAPVPDRHS